MRTLAIAALTLAAASMSNTATARWSDMVMVGLKGPDLTLAKEAAAKLEGKTVGDEVSWNNEATGNSGIVRLLAVDEQDGMPCQTRGHIVKVASTNETQKLVFRRCKTPDGRWLLAPKE